ncbi:MAG: cell division protein ZapA [Deltaproteobacteria bacterium]|nr:cell division protein ZapA [Deltaproteobacteria bacterium]
MKKSYDLTILNQPLTIKSDGDEKQVKKVADYVNKRMHEIVTSKKAISTANVAILAALNIAEDLFNERRGHSEKVRGWVARFKELLSGKEVAQPELKKERM